MRAGLLFEACVIEEKVVVGFKLLDFALPKFIQPLDRLANGWRHDLDQPG